MIIEIGERYHQLIMIISRALGVPVITGTIEYAAQLVKGNYKKIIEEEFSKTNKAGLKRILEEIKSNKKEILSENDITMPPSEVVTEQIAGIEIMDLEDAVKKLWESEIYAESGMGCTRPIILVSEKNIEIAIKILIKAKYITQ